MMFDDPASRAVILSYAGFLGAWTGSFVGCAAYRLPRGMTMGGRSHCESCGRTLGIELTPVLGWLAFRGRCRGCAAKVPAIYPLIEAGLAAVFVAITLRWGLGWRSGLACLAASCALYVAMCRAYFHTDWPKRMVALAVLLALAAAVR